MTDTLIIVFSKTKKGNGLHKCVSFHVCDLLPDIRQMSGKPIRIQVSQDNDPRKRLNQRVMCYKMTENKSNKVLLLFILKICQNISTLHCDHIC